MTKEQLIEYDKGFEAAETKWIKCIDELPSCDSQHGTNFGSGYLLGFTEYGETEVVQLWNGKMWETDDGTITHRKEYITHWMPLPKSPNNE